VVGWENFSTGQTEFVHAAKQNPRFHLVTGDNLDLKHLAETMAGCDTVFQRLLTTEAQAPPVGAKERTPQAAGSCFKRRFERRDSIEAF